MLGFIINKNHWQFVFIGDADPAFRKRFQYMKNVHLFPPVDYDRLPDCLNYFDLAFTPIKRNEHTRDNDLLKLHDYLAMGKPVVSTTVGGAEDLKNVICLADTHLEFIEKMSLAIHTKDPDTVSRRKSAARMNSWPMRIIEIENIVKKNLTDLSFSHERTV